MLESLTVKNFGIIENVTIEFSSGLNVLTGETGAGKSILIDALRFGLGERFQASQLRDNAESCTVEAVFHVPPALLQDLPAFEDFKGDDNTLIIQRTVSADGKNRIKVNGLTATVAQLKEIGDRLIDFHGPHDHQLLLAERQHLVILDALTAFGDSLKKYSTAYAKYNTARSRIKDLHELAASRERDLDLVSHQIKELEQVPLEQDHLEEIERDRVKINNAEKLYENIREAMAVLENDEASLELLLSKAFKPLQSLASIDEKASSLVDDVANLQDDARSLLSELRDYSDSLHFDPEQARTINNQFDAYHDIQRKYGPTLVEAKTFYLEAKEKYALLSDFEHNEETAQKEFEAAENALRQIAKIITNERKKTADSLKKTIEQELQELGFKSIEFEARISPGDFSPHGADQVVFFISTNAGESLRPLAEIVSSGEAARLMLAIKRALMKVDPVPVLIFDEVDSQIGGRLGTVIGTKLKEIAAHRQVVLITHLPQIAAFAKTHIKIVKAVDKGRTKTILEKLEKKSRIEELAHMMAGDTMTGVAVKHAEELLANASQKG